jgi:hypothetical protein
MLLDWLALGNCTALLWFFCMPALVKRRDELTGWVAWAGIVLGVSTLVGVAHIVMRVREAHIGLPPQYTRALGLMDCGHMPTRTPPITPPRNTHQQVTPLSIKLATVVGMGLLIALIGMVSIKLVVPDPNVSRC